MKLFRALAGFLLLSLAACGVRVVKDPEDGSTLAKCYAGAFVSFCQVANPTGHAVVSGSGVVPMVSNGAGVVTEAATIGRLLHR